MSHINNYPAVIQSLREDRVSIDFREEIFTVNGELQIAELDHEMMNRCFCNEINEPSSRFNSMREIHLHSFIVESLWHTLRGKFVCVKRTVERIKLAEKIKCFDANSFISVSLPKKMVDEGFSLVSPCMIPPENELSEIRIVYDGPKYYGSIENDQHVANVLIISMT